MILADARLGRPFILDVKSPRQLERTKIMVERTVYQPTHSPLPSGDPVWATRPTFGGLQLSIRLK